MLPDQRALFDIPEDVVYINCAYLSPNLKAQREMGHWAVDRKVHPWTIEWKHFYDDVERARVLFARLINASADDIAVVAATSYGVATASQNLGLKAGQSVVGLEGEKRPLRQRTASRTPMANGTYIGHSTCEKPE